MQVAILDDPAAIGTAISREILADIQARSRTGSRYLLGCPGGRSFRATYQALAELGSQRDVDWSSVVIVMMDDYLIRTGNGPVRCPEDAHYSCQRFGVEEIWRPINRGRPGYAQMPRENVWLPDPADPASYDLRIGDAGGIDLFLIASGASDGHVAFNPPGTPIDSQTRIVELTSATRTDNLATFQGFVSIDEVPTIGVSVGLGTITRLSRRAIMALAGQHKQQSARRLFAAGRFDPTWPATCIYECADPLLFVDRAALAGVDRLTIGHPG